MERLESRTVSHGGAELFLVERGDPTTPTIVFVHGYPDTHRCWDEVAQLLEDRFHVVAYDTRGVGRSNAPERRDAFALEHLTGDLGAVIDAVSPDQPVHLVGHDWGAFQCWEAVVSDELRDRVASFTAVAGPRIDRARGWALQRLRRPSPRALAELGGQA